MSDDLDDLHEWIAENRRRTAECIDHLNASFDRMGASLDRIDASAARIEWLLTEALWHLEQGDRRVTPGSPGEG